MEYGFNLSKTGFIKEIVFCKDLDLCVIPPYILRFMLYTAHLKPFRQC